MTETEDIVKLGGNIEISGAKDLDTSSMVILKKMIGSYAKKFSETINNFEKLSLNIKHEGENYELQAELHHEGKVTEAQSSGNNLFVALDDVMKQLEKTK